MVLKARLQIFHQTLLWYSLCSSLISSLSRSLLKSNASTSYKSILDLATLTTPTARSLLPEAKKRQSTTSSRLFLRLRAWKTSPDLLNSIVSAHLPLREEILDPLDLDKCKQPLKKPPSVLSPEQCAQVSTLTLASTLFLE